MRSVDLQCVVMHLYPQIAVDDAPAALQGNREYQCQFITLSPVPDVLLFQVENFN